MSGARLGRRRTVSLASPVAPMQLAGATGEEALTKLERGLDQVTGAVNDLIGSVYMADVELAVGTNIISHGLNRKPSLVTVTPASASASFAWGWDPVQSGNPRPTQITQIVVVGSAMTARVVVE